MGILDDLFRQSESKVKYMAKIDCFISVIAPLYNHSQIVKDVVAEVMQVLRNNYTNYELVLVNDGSEDNSLVQEVEF